MKTISASIDKNGFCPSGAIKIHDIRIGQRHLHSSSTNPADEDFRLAPEVRMSMMDIGNVDSSPPHSALVRMLPKRLRHNLEQHSGLVKIIDNIGWLVFDKILRMGIALLVGVWVARYLGPEQYGQLNYAIAFVALFGAIAGLGLNGIVVRDIVKYPESAKTTIGTAFLLQVLGGLIAATLIIGTMAWLRPNDTFAQTMVAVLGIGLIFKSTEVVKYWFESQVQSRYSVWVENGVFVFMASIKVAMILTKATLMAFVWLTLAEAALVAVGLVTIYMARGGDFYSCHPNIQRVKSLLRDSWSLLLANLAVVVYMRVDMVMLDQLAGSREVGIYAAATGLSEIWYVIPMVLVGSVSPSLIRCHSIDKSLFFNRLRRLYFYLAWLAIFISLPLSLLSGRIIDIFYGKEFAEAAPILAIHLWASIAVFLGVASSQYLLTQQLQKISFYRTTIGMACNIFLNLILIPSMGAMGAAIATVVAYFLSVFSIVLFKETRAHTAFLITAIFRIAQH